MLTERIASADANTQRLYRRGVVLAHLRAVQLSARILLGREPDYLALVNRARRGYLGG